MRVLMGGPGSTGSSLLQAILNRHPAVFAGPELNFFNKHLVFEDWQATKQRLLSPDFARLTTHGWFPYPGHQLLAADYGWNKAELESLLVNSTDLATFVDAFFERPLKQSRASMWIEKTPSNSYCFPQFLDCFPDSKVIHTIRNPYDAVTSLVRRGFTPIFAAGMWVYNAAAALVVRESARYDIIKYEDLVGDPVQEILRLQRFIEVDLDPLIVTSFNDCSDTVIESWINQPKGQISVSSVGAFEALARDKRMEVSSALRHFRISRRHAKTFNFEFRTCEEICAAAGYDFVPDYDPRLRMKMRLDLQRDWILRSRRRYSTGWWFYPAQVW